jgi:hypothetical protein
MAARIPLAFRRGPRRKSKPIELINKWHIYRGDLVRLNHSASMNEAHFR